MINLDAATRESVERILKERLPGVDVLLVGSRTREAVKRYADIDLLVMRDEPLAPRDRAMINAAFEFSDIPYKVDLLEWVTLPADFREALLENSEVLIRRSAA